MAHTVKTEKVVATHLGGVDTSGSESAAGGTKIVCGILDVTDTATAGVTVQAAELGLSKIYGIVLTNNQSGVGDTNIITATPAADEKSVVVIFYGDDGTAENGSDAGECAFVAFGEG